MSLGNKTKSTQTTTQNSQSTGTQTKDPWAPVIPYLTGDNGALSAVGDVYSKYGKPTEELTKAFSDMAGAARGNAATAQGLTGQIKPAGPVTAQQVAPGTGQVSAPTIVKGQYAQGAAPVGVLDSFGKLGKIDPTNAFGDLLSGEVNPYTQQQLEANTAATKASFDQMVSDARDALREEDMPAIRAAANLSGQYGGSRQGVAQGVAEAKRDKQLQLSAQGLNTALGATNASTLAAASEAAQGRKAGAAQFLGGLGVQTDVGNADRAQDLSKFNASLDADLNKFNASTVNDATRFNAGNALDLAKTNAGLATGADQTNVSTALANNDQTLNAAKTASGLTGEAYDQLLAALTGEGDFTGNQLANFVSLLSGIGGMGGSGTSTESGTSTSNSKGTQSSGGLTSLLGGLGSLGMGLGTLGWNPFKKAA